MSTELKAEAVQGWTVAHSITVNPDFWWVVYVQDGEVKRMWGGGPRREAETVAAALDAVEKTDLHPGDPNARSLILKGLKTTLDLARQKAEADGTLTLYDYDLKVTLGLIVNMEKRQNPAEQAAVKLPNNLS